MGIFGKKEEKVAQKEENPQKTETLRGIVVDLLERVETLEKEFDKVLKARAKRNQTYKPSVNNKEIAYETDKAIIFKDGTHVLK